MENIKDSALDVSSLFTAVGIKAKVKIIATEHTYEVDPSSPKDNWLYPAFEGFKKLRQKLAAGNKTVGTFVAIGSGQGIDAIGAYHILHPKNIIITDIHPEVVPVAQRNFLENVTAPTPEFQALVGNLCEPLRENKIKADVIYANLPNIPLDGDGSAFGGQLTSTFFDMNWIRKCPRFLEQYLLCLQNTFLYDAYNSLTPGGSVLVNLGGRVPLEVAKEMFISAGYQYQELYNMFKLQTQPEWVLGGYARAEEKNKIIFDFYRFDLARQKLGERLDDENISSAKLKKLLKPLRVSATEALKLFVYNHERIGHTVQLIRGIKI